MQKTLTGEDTKQHTKTQADELAKKQREISVAEFFAKNRHLLGFDNKRKALLTSVKEAVDNSLDACEESHVLPEIIVELIDMGDDRYRIIVEDNGPGIIKSQIPKIFAKLLYGSKFHSLKQSRGQQGIGISASVMYAQMTTGKAAKITSKTGENKPTHHFELMIDTKTNQPKILKDELIEWEGKDHGTRIEIDIEASYQKGAQSIDTFLKQTAIANPHATIIYTSPKAEQFIFARGTDKLPQEPKEIKPHPYGVELGTVTDMIHDAGNKPLQSFLANSFSRVSSSTAKEICDKAKILPNKKSSDISREEVSRLMKAIKQTKIIAPPSDSIAPIGAEELEKGLRKEINAEFYCSTTRPPSVYRGNPFVIECSVAYGGELKKDDQIKIMRFANRVPLLFQQGACSTTQSIVQTNWKPYGLQQSRNSMPVGPAVVVIHLASVWAPFTSEAKEALAHYPEIIKEVKLAVQEVGRKLARYTAKKKKVKDEMKKRSFIEKYIPHLGNALQKMLSLSEAEEKSIEESLKILLEKKRGKFEEIEFDPSKNTDYDEAFAKIGAEEEPEEDQE